MIDQSRLKELEEDFGAEELAEIVDAFIDEAKETLDELRSLGTGSDPNAVARHLHFLKGCARNVGATELGNMCEALEAESGDNVPSEIVEKIAADLDSVRNWFQAELSA